MDLKFPELRRPLLLRKAEWQSLSPDPALPAPRPSPLSLEDREKGWWGLIEGRVWMKWMGGKGSWAGVDGKRLKEGVTFSPRE